MIVEFGNKNPPYLCNNSHNAIFLICVFIGSGNLGNSIFNFGTNSSKLVSSIKHI